jgi:CHAT domain-containing protein/Flp pilus assembly protein TadD
MPNLYKFHHYFKVAAVIASCASWSTFTPASFAQSQPNQDGLYRLGTSLPDQASTKTKSEADRLLQQGIEQYDRDQYDDAFKHWEQALKLYQQLGDLKMKGETLRHLGRVYYTRNENAKAFEYFKQSLTIAREVKNRATEGRTLNNLGLIYEAQKQRDEALESYTQSMTIAREVNDKFGEAITSLNLGLFHQYTDFGEAHRAFQNSIKLWRELNDPKREANTLLNFGHFFVRWNNYSRAIEEAYEPSLKVFRALKDRSGEGYALAGIGNCHIESNQPEKAIEYLNQSLLITREVKDRWYEGVVLSRLGKSHQYLDELDNQRILRGFMSTNFREPARSIENATKAVAYSQQALKIAREVKNRWGEALTLANLGRSYVVLGEYQKAIETQKQRRTITLEYQDWQNEAKTLTDLASAYEGLRDYKQAIASHQAAISIYRTQYGNRVNQQIGTLNSFFFPFELREALIRLGDTYHNNGNYPQAISVYQEAQGRNKPSGGSSDFILHSKLGSSLVKAGRFKEAEVSLRFANEFEDDFRQAVAISKDSTDTSRIRMAEILTENYRQLQQALVGQNRINEALEIAEKSRARAFVELLAARISGQPILKNQELSEAPKIDGIRAIAQAQNSTLVQYSLVESDLLYIWVIQPNGSVTFKSVNLKTASRLISELVQQSRRSMGVRSAQAKSNGNPISSNNFHTKELAELHRLLIEPISAELPSDPNQRIVFMPQGSLFLVPFPALKNAQGKFLIEQHTISTAPSIQTLALTRQQRKSSSTGTVPLIVGNPTMPKSKDYELIPLAGAEKEARSIAQLFNTNALTGGEATKQEVLKRMTNAPIVHLATHGLLDTIEGDTPGAIVLAPSAQDSGFLSANEIFDLKLNANLVVLSACDTGRGKITGDGVIGLSRSFVAAGVPSVMVSLWAVDDNSTSVLMNAFYRNLQTNPNKATALRQAMLSTMKQHPEPIDWAAFTLIGEAQ